MIQCFITDIKDITQADLNVFQTQLSDKEHTRLNQMKNIKRKTEFIMGRVLIKNVCAKLLKQSAEHIQIESNEKGALFLPDYSNYFISLSHSNPYIVLAVASYPIGLDIEKIKNRPFNALMRHEFSADIPSDWHQRKLDDKKHLFYTLWTQKEATFKLKSIKEQKKNIYYFPIKEVNEYTISIASYNKIKSDIKLNILKF